MADTLPAPTPCCTDCADPVVTSIPGPKGDACTPCNDGADGIDAFSFIDGAAFAVPALGAVSASIALSDPQGSRWMVIGQVVYVGDNIATGYGYFQVNSIPDDNHVTLLNLGDGTLYPANVDNTVNFADGTKISPGGVTGPQGTAGVSGAPTNATYITQTPNGTLSAEQALSALGTGLMKNATGTGVVSIVTLGIAANNVAPVNAAGPLVAGEAVFAVATGIESKTAANSRTALGLGTIATQAANAVAITGGSISGITDLPVADGGTGASTANAAQDNLGKLLPRYGLLGSLTAVDLNVATSDNAVTMRSSRYRIDKLTVENGSVNLNTATAGLFTAAGGGGTTLAADQALAALSASGKFDDLTLEAVVGTDVVTAATLYFRVGTPQGVAATCNVWIFGWRMD